MITLVKRPAPSRLWAWSTPLLAVLATMIAGGVLFALLGKNPFEAIRTIFWDPLFGPNAAYFRGQLLVKAGPLILIASGLAVGFRAGVWRLPPIRPKAGFCFPRWCWPRRSGAGPGG